MRSAPPVAPKPRPWSVIGKSESGEFSTTCDDSSTNGTLQVLSIGFALDNLIFIKVCPGLGQHTRFERRFE